ncbi:protein CLT2, chloroplastic isoform X2 [Aristolochia californica]|uniref:protein CLT2, chloroplastic isoform X2 n=1 Tax=Aristolochia californica TaxID=171875 RepID=UPI0035DE88C5
MGLSYVSLSLRLNLFSVYHTHHHTSPRSHENSTRVTNSDRKNPNMHEVAATRSSFTSTLNSSRRAFFERFVFRKRDYRIFVSDAEPSFSDDEGDFIVGNGRRIAFGSAITVALSVMNRVLYKLALVPMQQYPFFLAQITTFGYVAMYFSILYGRYYAGIVTKEMLALPKSHFMTIGFLEALGVASGMAAAAMLPGPAIPILSQTFLVWQLVFSSLILGRKYSLKQILGCLLVASGVVIAMTSGVDHGQMFTQEEFMWPMLMIASSGFQAAASIIKGKSLDIFVVNSFGSGFQALFVLLLLPFLSNLRGIPFAELPSYLKDGAACFLNIGANVTGCEGAPFLPLLYIAVNMGFNIAVLSLLKISSAVVTSLVATLSVPITIYVLTLPLPNLPQSEPLSPFLAIGSAFLVSGLLLYNLSQPAKESSKQN